MFILKTHIVSHFNCDISGHELKVVILTFLQTMLTLSSKYSKISEIICQLLLNLMSKYNNITTSRAIFDKWPR